MTKKLNTKELDAITYYLNLVAQHDAYSRGYADVVADNIWHKYSIEIDALNRGNTDKFVVVFHRAGKIIAIGEINPNGKWIKKCASCPKRDEKFLIDKLKMMMDIFGIDASEYAKGSYSAHKHDVVSKGYTVLEIQDQKLILFFKRNKIILVGDAEHNEIEKCI